MALKATVFKVDLQIADMDRNYYQSHALTVARHASETDERMMVRLLTFALYASGALAFGKGIAADDEPTMWEKDLTGAIERWIEVGQPDERDIRKASGRAKHVVIVTYGRSAEPWWELNRDKLQRIGNLTVLRLPVAATQALATLANRNMQLQCSVQEHAVLITTDAGAVQVEPQMLMDVAYE
ncbi:MAG: YaeQ family protein [Gammaproteobacteria bacterium]|nr:YaeQ family protein [Gammaproteobacteria bacterium]